MSISSSREKIIADIISRALRDVRLADRYLMTAGQHRARAQQLCALKPDSRAAELHDLAARMIDLRLGEQ
jgi:hypothetical protein